MIIYNYYSYYMMTFCDVCPYVDEPRGTSISEEAANIVMTDVKTPEEAPEATDSSSSSYSRDLANTNAVNKETLFSIAPSGTRLSLFFLLKYLLNG